MLRFAKLHPAILVVPGVIALFADPVGTARAADLQRSAPDITKDTDDLFYTEELSLNTAQFSGAGSSQYL